MTIYTLVFLTRDGDELYRQDRECLLAEAADYVDDCVDQGIHDRAEILTDNGICVYRCPGVELATPSRRSATN